MVGHQAHGRAVGPTGSTAVHGQVRDVFRNCLIVLKSDSERHDRVDRRRLGVQRRHGRSRPSPIRKAGSMRYVRPSRRAARAGHARIRQRYAPGCWPIADAGYGFSTWSVARLAAHLAKTMDSLRPGPARPPVAPPRFLVPAPQAHDEGQAGRDRVPEVEGGIDRAKKKAMRKNAAEALVFRTR